MARIDARKREARGTMSQRSIPEKKGDERQKTEQEAANLCREKVWVSRLTHFPGNNNHVIITALVTILYETAVNIFTV